MISDHFSSNKSNDGQVGHMAELVHSGAVDRLDGSSGADTFKVQAGEHRSPGKSSGGKQFLVSDTGNLFPGLGRRY